ncbi:MAG: hypothetical protein U9P14_12905 [Gemmatimonadota bacterium]|nr:hypothetical protein [Gemmatimonadota bacterium]
MELYPTFSAVGLEIDFPDSLPVGTEAAFEWRIEGEAGWNNGVELTLSPDGRKAWASIWPLEMDTPIEVRLSYSATRGKRSLIQQTRTRKIVIETSGGRQIYVSPQGDDGAQGTAGEPYRTLAAAALQAVPGDRVVVGGGVYHEGDLFAGLRGEPDNPIVITAGDGVRPVLDGSVEIGQGESGWHQEAEGLFAIELKPETGYVGYVAQDGLRMFWSKTLDNMLAGKFLLNDKKRISTLGRAWFYDSTAAKLYVRTGDKLAPKSHTYNAAVHRHGALLNAAIHVVLQGLELRYYGESAVRLENGATGCALLDNVVHNSQCGVTFYDSSTSDNAIWRNEIYEKGLHDATWAAIKSSSYGRQAIEGVAGRGNSFCYNEIHGYFDAIAPAQWGDWNKFYLNRDLDLMFNEMYNIGDDAVEVEGGGVNIRVHGNRMRNVFSAISLAPIEAGPIYVTRNDATYHILMFKLNVGGVVSEGHTYCYHNSGYSLTHGDPYGGIAINFPSAGDIPIDNKVFKNNVFVCDNFCVRFANERYDIDGNCYWSVSGREPLVYRWEQEVDGEWPFKNYLSIDDFSAATGCEQHGIEADPQFRSPAGLGGLERVYYGDSQFSHYPSIENTSTGDLRLQSSSPCIDRALLICGINDRVRDGKPDMGAFEFGEDD